jgi:four helix bundle protein
MQDFRKLRVWQRAHAFELTVDKFVRRLPRQCPVAKKSQLTRSTESVPANIAEGCGAATQREFARFLDSAIKSTSEIENHLLSIKGKRYATAAECEELIDEISQIRRMLYSLRKKVLADLGDT